MTTEERLTELRAWALNRLRTAREDERKFSYHRSGLEAAQERRTLLAVFGILGWSDPDIRPLTNTPPASEEKDG